ncbi:MAG TPA: transketolase [Clostridiales bacterium]|nr:transketolase [Clostridiales bacterium]
MNNIDDLAVNAIRILSADQVQKANSGHPGLPLGAAPMAYELFANHLKHNPSNPNWADRDRFILSAGHGSAMIYSILHLFGYGDLSIEDLKQFRQIGSLTPGHPEYRDTAGVEATTGPLGAGMAMAVGMAMAEEHLAATFNKEGYSIVDHYTFALGGDGCMMEGISSEAFSLAGTLGLDKLIVLYDSNKITIEGGTDLAFTENVEKRLEAYGFQTIVVEDGNDLSAIGKAIELAKQDKERPSFITIKTKIGYGSAKEGMASAHGEPLGDDNVAGLRKKLEWPSTESFEVPNEVYEHYQSIGNENSKKEEEWNALFKEYCDKYPKMKELWDKHHDEDIAKDLIEDEEFWAYSDKAEATRSVSGNIINRIKDIVPGLIGGSADLAPSTKTYMNDEGDFGKDNYAGRNLRFGVRELAMAGMGSGLALHGGLRPYVSTFFVFSDYMKPMARLAAIMRIPVTYVLTHDSIGVGEDGPTHQPIEQLSMLRSTPNITVFRPADATETIAAWYYAITSTRTPTVLALSRQNLSQLEGSSKEALKGGYVVDDSKKETPDAIIIATGSEVELAIASKKQLETEGIDARVVSMPSMDLFEKQSKEYKEEILPKAVRSRVVIEAASDFGWGKYIGLDGAYINMDSFGASGPADKVFEKFGFTVDNVVKTVKSVL